MKQVQYSINMAAGAGVDFVAGPIEVKGADGKTYRTSGIYNPETRRVTIQVDNAKYTPAEIADRQKFLIAAQRDPGLTDEIRDRIVERFGRSEMQRVLRSYIVNMRGAYDIGDGSIDAMDTAARTILNQVFADANAGINSFDADTRKYRFDTKNAMSKRADRQTGTEPKRERGKVRLATRPGEAGGVRYSAVNREGLSTAQRATIRVAETVANATGLDIRVVDMGKGYGGAYFPGSGGVMYLNISASLGGRNIAVASMSHELTHWLQEYAADEYATLKQVVLDEIKKDPARYESIFTDREEAYGNIADLTEDQITDEMVANACQTVLMDPDTVRRIASEQPTLAERIRNFIIRMIDDIKAAFSEMPDTDRSIFQEVKAAEGALDQIRETWLNAFDTAAENLKAEQGANKKAATEGGSVQYMAIENMLTEKDLDAYLTAGNRNNKNKMKALSEGKKIILTSEDEIRTYIRESIHDVGSNATAAYGRVDKRLSEDVKKSSGGTVDITRGYEEFVPYDLKHSYDQHHNPKEPGDIPLTDQDYENIPAYIDSYDELLYVTTYEGSNQTTICVSKNIGRGRVLLIEVVSKSRGSIQFKNAIGVSEEKYNEEVLPKYNKSPANTREGKSPKNDTLRDARATNDSIANQDEDVKGAER